jgi:hypothetical protein
MSLRSALFPVSFLLILSVPMNGFSQDTAWESRLISPDVSIDMPGPVERMDTVQLKISSSQYNGYEFQVKYIKPALNVRNGDELVQAYDGFLDGYLKSKDISLYTNTISDTSFDGTTGKWIHSSYAKEGGSLDMYTYAVLVNSHFYMVTLAGARPLVPAAGSLLSRYYSSLHFLCQPIKEYSGDFPLRAKSYRLGQRLGRMFPLQHIVLGLFAVVLIVPVIIRIRRRKGKI